MWKAYAKMDGWIISTLQNYYLWLLDRTGVYVATLMFVAFTVDPGVQIVQGKSPAVNGLCIALVGFLLATRYLSQDKGDTTAYNAFALIVEGLLLRHAFIGMQFGFLTYDLVRLNYLGAIGTIFAIIYIYLWAIKIRDRDKKPFFEKKEQLAMEGSSR